MTTSNMKMMIYNDQLEANLYFCWEEINRIQYRHRSPGF